MPTRRTLLLLVAGLACLVIVLGNTETNGDRSQRWSMPGAIGSGEAVSAAGPVVVSTGNKPLGPVAVLLQDTESTPRGQRVRATLRPVRTLRSVAWRWESSEGVVLLAGAAAGTADPTVGVSSELEALVLPPASGRSGRLTLVTEATFDGADAHGPTGPEVAIQCTDISWGDADSTSVPIVTGIDHATGEAASWAVVPSSHRPKR